MTNLETRIELSLNLDWRFTLGDDPRAWQGAFDDAGWQAVTLPHDWAVAGAFDQKHSSGTGYLPAGVGWYRKRFPLPENLRGKRALLVFDGVYNNSQVWCNGYYLGKRPFGYTEFSYDVTDFAKFGGEENLICVRVNHEHAADSRWFTGSGIHRDVRLVLTEALCVAPHGVFFRGMDPATGGATVEVSLQNHSGEDAGAEVCAALIDAQGNTAGQATFALNVKAGGEGACQLAVPVAAPHHWSVDDPYLYTLAVEVRAAGRTADCVKIPVGLRTFSFDANRGFSLNGVSMKLKGVCVHHDAGCLGAAVRPKVWRRRLETLKAMGCNAIRMSHNPHTPALYDLCDEMGFLVIDEAFDEWEGVKNKWARGHNVYPPEHYGYYEDFPQWHEADLTALVLRDRNHPSVILWSIGNEIDYPNDPYCHPIFENMTGNNDANKPAAERVYDSRKPNAARLPVIARKLYEIVKRSDDTRPVTLALAFPELSNHTGLPETLDVAGYNYKEQFYEEDHRAYPNRVMLGTENGKGFEQWVAVRDNEYISGQFLWTGIDFLGETRGWPSHGSSAGLMNIAGHEKASYYHRRALWCESPVMQLVTRPQMDCEPWWKHEAERPCWTYAAGELIDVICYTNRTRVELFLNGKSLGTKERAEGDAPELTWQVPFAAGEIRAVGTGAESALRTTGAPVAIRAAVSDAALRADGQDMAHIEIALVDGAGEVVERACNLVRVEVEGAGHLLGLESGSLEDNAPYALPYRAAHNGRLLAFIGAGAQAGKLRVKVSAEGLQGSEFVIDVK